MSLTIQEIEKDQMKKNVPSVSEGDTVVVSKIITEGKKSRIQKYEGVVLKKQNTRSRTQITVRKVVDKIGVEKTFLLHSPLVEKIEVIKRGKTRRARLYYLRKRTGKKATRIKSAD
ncbi:MAG: 50S ribosomal protein L19 [bacterium]|nr:50S ribosomal protein L19 [bacterium]